jgi:hypothetical protein
VLDRLPAIAILAMLVVSPIASAGSEANPEVDDSPDVSRGSLDLLSVWFENTWSGVRFTVKLRSLDTIAPGYEYLAGFEVHGDAYWATVALDADGRARSIVASPGWRREHPTPDTFPDTLRDVEVRRGAPGYVSATIPWGVVPGFEPGVVLTDLAGATDDGVQGGKDHVDLRRTESAFVTARDAPTAAVAGAAALGLAAVAGVGAWAWRRGRPSGRRGDAAPARAEGTDEAGGAALRHESPMRLDPRR